MNFLLPLLLLWAPSAQSATTAENPQCFATKAAFDIGSGATKLKVAIVNTCQKTIHKVLWESQKAVAYRASLSSQNSIPENLIQKGLEALSELKKQAKSYGATNFKGVATSAFRRAENGKKIIDYFNKILKINIRIISQDEEAELGYSGAMLQVKKPLILWDIGGGSMQMLYKSKNEKLSYKSKLASISFRDYLISEVQRKSLRTFDSPNPVNETELDKALNFLNKRIPQELDGKLQARLKGGEVFGIGGVHRHAVAGLVGSDSWNTKTLKSSLEKILKKTDSQLGGGEFVSTKVSNAILVLGMMEATGISQVKSLNVNLTDGILVKK